MTVYFDASGRALDESDALDGDVVRDGVTVRTSMMMRDADTEDARRRKKTTRYFDPAGRSAGSAVTETEEDDTADSAVLRDAWGRPTNVVLPDADARRAVSDARAEMVREKSDAWRGRDAERWWQPKGGHWMPNQARGPQPGDECMTDDTHERGRLVVEGNDLVCRALPQSKDAVVGPTNDPVLGQQLKDQAYNAMLADKANAWRNSGA